jgi:transmembrane sensor
MQQSGENKLLKRYQVGECMPEEQAMIAHDIIYVDVMQQNLLAMQPALDQLRSGTIRTHIKTREMIPPARIIVAAIAIAILLGIDAGILSPDNSQPAAYTKNVNPGLDKAILTLGNETRINLSEARSSSLLNQLAVEIIKAEDGNLVYNVASKSNTSRYNTIATTAKGGQYKTVLSDDTRGWLNAASELFHNTSLKVYGGERKVNVLGDAYFEV